MQEIGGILSDRILKGLSMIIVEGDFESKFGGLLGFYLLRSSPHHLVTKNRGGIERYRAVARL